MRARASRHGGFTLIELMIVVAIVGVLTAIAIPNLLASRISANETGAIATCRFVCTAQMQFIRSDYYGVGMLVYANPEDGTGYVDLHQLGGLGGAGDELKLIDRTIAMAWYSGDRTARSGYLFEDVLGDTTGPYEYWNEFGLQAVPERVARTGRNMFVVEVTGLVYGMFLTEDTVPDQTFPDVNDGWMLMGSD